MSGEVDRHIVTIWRSENSHFYQEHARNGEEVNIWWPYLATDYWSSLSLLPNQRIIFCKFVGKLYHSTVIQFTTKYYVPTRRHSPHCRHIVLDCLDEDFSKPRYLGHRGNQTLLSMGFSFGVSRKIRFKLIKSTA